MSLAITDFTAKNKKFVEAYNQTLDLLRAKSLNNEANKFEAAGSTLIKEVINNERKSGPNNEENTSPELQKHMQATQQIKLLGITLSKYLENPDDPSLIKNIDKQTRYMQSLTQYVSASSDGYIRIPLVEMPESVGKNELPGKSGVLNQKEQKSNWASTVQVIPPREPQDKNFKAQFEKETGRLLEGINGLEGFLNTTKLFTENDAKKPLQDSLTKLRLAIINSRKAVMGSSATSEESKSILLEHQNINAKIIDNMNKETRRLNSNNLVKFVHTNSQIMDHLATAMDLMTDTLTLKQKRER